MKSMFSAVLGAAVLLAAQPASAQFVMTRTTPGVTYYHKAGATLADHDTQLAQCVADAQTTAQPASGGNALVLINPALGIAGVSYDLRRNRAGRRVNIENCMVANRWAIMTLGDADASRLSPLVREPARLHAALAGMVGAERPVGILTRWFTNDAVNGASDRFSGAERTEGVSLSLEAGMGASRGLIVLPPTPALPRPTLATLPLEPLERARHIRVTDDSTLVFIRLTGDIRVSADIIAFERLGPDASTPAWVDQRANLFAPSLNHRSVERGLPRVGVYAYRLPPGRWRLAGMARTDMAWSFCQGTIAFDARPGEALYLGSFDLSGQMLPDMTMRDDIVPASRRPEGLRAAEYTAEGRYPCSSVYIYGIEFPAS
ncbi:MAG: hypothetical protein EON85_11765 [Brevundimonas sp.]|nr:MAG: hypothetical protein EON85_11765 [Brevundimonas sp.]